MLTLVRCDPATNMRRFYNLSLQPDLLGDVELVREFGRIGQPGTVKVHLFGDEEAAFTMLHKLKKAKEKKGYQLKSVSSHLAAMLQRLEEAKEKTRQRNIIFIHLLAEAKKIRACQCNIIFIYLAALAETLQKPRKPRKKKPTKLKEISISFDENKPSATMKGEAHDSYRE